MFGKSAHAIAGLERTLGLRDAGQRTKPTPNMGTKPTVANVVNKRVFV